MTRKKIVLVRDAAFQEDEPYLEYEGDSSLITEMVNDPPPPTLEELADFCDANAESRNNHDFVGSHRILAAILHKKVGRKTATAIMQEIAELGGLDGASGHWWGDGREAAFGDFGIKDCWGDWSLGGLN